MKKNKWIKKRHKIIFSFLRPIFKIIYKWKYNLKIKKEKLPLDGSLILCNHTMAIDPLLIGIKFDQPIYFMASKDLFQKKYIGKLLTYLVHPIPKEKSNKSDLSAIKDCVSVSKENGNICIFPEGNRTYSGRLGNVDFSIVKLVKLLKKPLIICNIIGGFSSDPRWSKKRRKGKLEVITKIKLDYDDYKDLDNDELYQLIIDNLFVDELKIDIPFKGKDKAEHLESIIHICPICHKEHNLVSKGDFLICKSCGLTVKFDDNKKLITSNKNFEFHYLHEWYDYQIKVLKEKEYLDHKLIYSDEIDMYEPINFKKPKLIGKGTISLYKDYFEFNLNNSIIKMDFNDIKAITLLGRNKMNIYYHDKVYQIYKHRKTNLIKYMHLFYILNNKKRGINDGFIGI